MKLIDRYLLAAVIAPAAFGLGMFSTLLMASYFLKHIDELVTRGVPASVIVRFLACYIPEVLVNALPMAVLFATLTAVGRLAADAELTAMYASGLSLRRILLPVAAAGVLASGLSFAVDEYVIPYSRAYGRHTYTNEVLLKNPLPKVARNVFFDGGGAVKMFVREVHLGSPTPPVPHQGDLPLAELWALLQQRRAKGEPLGDLEMRFWWKVAFPLASLAMALLGAPLACRTARAGPGIGVGLAVPLSIAYYVVFAICRGAAEAGKMDALIAMWTPNALTLMAAGVLYWTASRQA
jgi:lipopolysaccharide export LptBFGC system permease protein LptF